MYVQWIVFELQQRMLISHVGYSVKRLKYAQNIMPISSAYRSRLACTSDLKFGPQPRDKVSSKRVKFDVRAVNSFWVTAADVD